MNNQAFRKQTDQKNRRKLEVVLRRMTGDALTEEQRRRLWRALEQRRQYCLRLCASKRAFLQAAAPATGRGRPGTVRILLGDLNDHDDVPLAALVRRRNAKTREHTLYLYLPDLKGEKRDETRTKERKEA